MQILKRGWGPHFLEKAAITNLNTWGSPPRGLSLTLLLLTSLQLLSAEVQFFIFHRWIKWFAPMFWLLSDHLSNDQWHHSFRSFIQPPNNYSTGLLTCPLILRLPLNQDLLLASLVGDSLKSVYLPIDCSWCSFIV